MYVLTDSFVLIDPQCDQLVKGLTNLALNRKVGPCGQEIVVTVL